MPESTARHQATTGGDVEQSIIVTQVFQQAQAAALQQRRDLRQMLRVLVVLAAPVAGPRRGDPPPRRLDLRAEWRRLVEAVRHSQAPIALIRLTPPTLDALRFALSPRAVEQDLAPHVLHFSGHGWAEGLMFEDEFGRAHLVRTADLLARFKDLAAPFHLAVFNSCQTAAGANAAAQALAEAGLARAALGHRDPVADDTAIRFAATLYAEMARGGYSLEEALDRARQAIAGQPDGYNPRPFGDLSIRLGPLPPGEPVVEDGRPPGSLPTGSAESFFGRGSELVELAQALADDRRRVIVLSGVAGIGKSALAAEAAHRNGWRFPGGATWAAAPHTPEAAATVGADDLLTRLTAGLGLALRPGERPGTLLHAHCADRPTLLLLDNLETWALARPEECGTLAEFLRALPAPSHALVTLRPPLPHLEGLPDAWPMRLVKGLEHPAAQALVRHLAETKEATRLLASRALVTRLARRLHGHPKMLEQAVALAKRPGGVRKLRTDLDDLRGDLGAQLEQMVGWSVDLLREEGRRLLPHLVLFPAGSCTEEAASAALGADAAAGLADLHDAALAPYDDRADRYGWHGSVVDYARRRAPLPEAEAGRVRLLEHYDGWVREIGWENCPAISAEHGNLWPLLEWGRATVEAGDEAIYRKYTELAEVLNRYFSVGGFWADGIRHLETALGIARILKDREREGNIAHHLAIMQQASGDYTQARQLYQQSRDIKEQLGDRQGFAATLVQMASLEQATGNYPAAHDLYQQGRAILEQLGDRQGLGVTLTNLGYLAWRTGDLHQAAEYFQTALHIHEQLGIEQAEIRRGGRVREWLAQVKQEMGSGE